MQSYATIEEFARFSTVTYFTVKGEDSKLSETDDFLLRNCLALPPKRQHLDTPIDLRLYCHWISHRIVLLYNGGIKTAANAQDCPNVSRHFYNAQSWTRQLNDIGVEIVGQDIANIEELYIKY